VSNDPIPHPELALPSVVTLAPPTSTLQLDLGCGQNVVPGFEGVDVPGIRDYLASEIVNLRNKHDRTPDEAKRLAELEITKDAIKYEVNLARFPWPWADSSVVELHASHFIEHLPMIFVDEVGNEVPFGTPGARELLFAFFDECYRVLVPGGQMKVCVPSARSNRGYQDPTHRRFFVGESFMYLWEPWRKANKLDHYNVKCNFEWSVDPGIFTHKDQLHHLQVRVDEVRNMIIDERWNIVADFHAKLRSLKPGPGPAS
jgi:hypothetical protein